MKVVLKKFGKIPVNNKVSAIKAARTLFGLGLKEAKDAIEEVMNKGVSEFEIHPANAPKHLDKMSPEMLTLMGEGIQIGGIETKKSAVIEALRSSAKVAMSDREYDLAISIIGVLKEHDINV